MGSECYEDYCVSLEGDWILCWVLNLDTNFTEFLQMVVHSEVVQLKTFAISKAHASILSTLVSCSRNFSDNHRRLSSRARSAH